MNQRLINFFTKDLFAKVVSILLATLFFFMYRALSLEQISFYIPVQVNLPDQVAVFSQSISTTRVTIRGTKEDLAQFDRRSLFLDVNVPEFLEGEHSYRIELNRNTNINQLSSLSITISPPAMFLTLEPIVSKSINIEAVLLGQPARGYAINKIQLAPSTVEITGPRSIVNAISHIRSRPVDVSDRKEPVEDDILLNFDNPKIILSNLKSRIYIDISSSYHYNHTVNIPLIITGLNPNLEISNWDQLVTAPISISSRLDNITSLEVNTLTLVLNLNKIESAGSYTLMPQLRNLQQLPDDYNIMPIAVNITIEEKGSL